MEAEQPSWQAEGAACQGESESTVARFLEFGVSLSVVGPVEFGPAASHQLTSWWEKGCRVQRYKTGKHRPADQEKHSQTC